MLFYSLCLTAAFRLVFTRIWMKWINDRQVDIVGMVACARWSEILSLRLTCDCQVIGTDMSKHMDHVANLRTRVEMQKLSSFPEGQIVLHTHADRVLVRHTINRLVVPLTYHVQLKSIKPFTADNGSVGHTGVRQGRIWGWDGVVQPPLIPRATRIYRVR